MTTKLKSGDQVPPFTLARAGGGEIAIGGGGDAWQMVVVYRGRHCPICKRYLARLEELKDRFAERGTEIVAISADPREKAEADIAECGWSFAVGYDLAPATMRALGVYISNPRSPEETDRPFAEPALFVIRPDGAAQIIDIANAPFVRPDAELILRGIEMAQDKGYPVRGTA